MQRCELRPASHSQALKQKMTQGNDTDILKPTIYIQNKSPATEM